jgi:anti-sigma factor RsiW
MRSCLDIDPLVTPYVDGELASEGRLALEEHLHLCAPCRARVTREQSARAAIRATRSAFIAEAAPASLHARCAACRVDGGTQGAATVWRARLAPLALAASLVVVVAGAFAYPLTARSSRIMAAELAVDHMKCSLFNSMLGTRHTASSVERSLAQDFDWPADLPDDPERVGLELVGERTCLYGEGRVAHVMYRHEGRPVSVFMLPDDVRESEALNVLGHRAVVWSVGGRTFVVVAREPIEDIERMASVVRASFR